MKVAEDKNTLLLWTLVDKLQGINWIIDHTCRGEVDFSVATEPWVVNIPKDPALDLPWCGLCACDWNELNECGCVLFTNLYNLEDKKPLYKGLGYRDPDRILETPRLPREKSSGQPRTPQIRAEVAIRSKKLNVKYLTSSCPVVCEKNWVNCQAGTFQVIQNSSVCSKYNCISTPFS